MVGIAIFGDFWGWIYGWKHGIGFTQFFKTSSGKGLWALPGRWASCAGWARPGTCDLLWSRWIWSGWRAHFFFIKMDGLTSWAIHLEVSHLVSQSEKMDDPKKIAYKDSFDGKHDDPPGFGVYPNLLDKPISSQPSMEHRAAWKWFHIEWLL